MSLAENQESRIKNQELRNEIESKVIELLTTLDDNKALVLTETDLQCQLYKKMSEINYLDELESTADEPHFRTNKIHTEVTWFDSSGVLSIRPDLTLMLPENLKISEGFGDVPLPSKGLHSVDGGIIFELKYDRELRTISEKTMEGMFKDIRNFQHVLNRFENDGNGEQIYGYFVLLIKGQEENIRNSAKIDLINRGLDESKCKFIYKFLNVIDG